MQINDFSEKSINDVATALNLIGADPTLPIDTPLGEMRCYFGADGSVSFSNQYIVLYSGTKTLRVCSSQLPIGDLCNMIMTIERSIKLGQISILAMRRSYKGVSLDEINQDLSNIGFLVKFESMGIKKLSINERNYTIQAYKVGKNINVDILKHIY